MLFVTPSGDYIEVLRGNYTTDTAYYLAVMKVKGHGKEQTPPPITLISALSYTSKTRY